MTRSLKALLAIAGIVGLTLTAAAAQEGSKPFEPKVGQPGKDVVWVPTPPEIVELMLDMAGVTAKDYVIDLGSGDGRNVIQAAKRGAESLGVEFNHDMVELSRRNASAAGVAGKATFVEGDMYKADISRASVMALFLLPSNLNILRPKFLELAPGSRIVSNTFTFEGWEPDRYEIAPNCTEWCTVYLWIVPAKVGGSWKSSIGDLTLKQTFQMLSGTLGDRSISEGRLRGDEISFNIGTVNYKGRVNGNTIEGTEAGSDRKWTARRQ